MTCFGRRMGKGMPASGPPRALALASPRRRPGAFRKPSLRRNRFSKNLHFGGICGISPLFHHMFSRKGRHAHLISEPFSYSRHEPAQICTGHSHGHPCTRRAGSHSTKAISEARIDAECPHLDGTQHLHGMCDFANQVAAFSNCFKRNSIPRKCRPSVNAALPHTPVFMQMSITTPLVEL